MNKENIEKVNFEELCKRLEDIKLSGSYWNKRSLLTQAVKVVYILLNTTNTENMSLEANLYKRFKFSPRELKVCVTNQTVIEIFSKKEIIKVQKIVRSYEKKYDQIVKKENASKSTKSQMIIRKFIYENHCSIEQFCEANKITIDMFREYVTYCKKNDNKLYEEYLFYKQEAQKENNFFIYKMWEEIKDKMKNGIKIDDETVRPFDLIDYFQITNLLPLELFNIIDEKDVQFLRMFKTFANKFGFNTELTKEEIQQLYDMKQEINLQIDENGNPIPNTGRIVTLQEKEVVIDYLIRNDIPIYSKVYVIALKRYLDNTLDINKTVSKKKVYKY